MEEEDTLSLDFAIALVHNIFIRELLKTVNLDFTQKIRSKLWYKLRFLAKTLV